MNAYEWDREEWEAIRDDAPPDPDVPEISDLEAVPWRTDLVRLARRLEGLRQP